MSKNIKKRKKRETSIKKRTQRWRRFVLIGISTALPILFLSLSNNYIWLQRKIIPYYSDMPRQAENTDIQSRKAERHGTTFRIINYVCQNVPNNTWFLVPPQAYYLDQFYSYKKPNDIQELFHFVSLLKVFNFHCQDLNLLTIDMADSLVNKAEYTLFAAPNTGLRIVKIDNNEILSEVKRQFNYKVSHTATKSGALKVLTEIQTNKR